MKHGTYTNVLNGTTIQTFWNDDDIVLYNNKGSWRTLDKESFNDDYVLMEEKGSWSELLRATLDLNKLLMDKVHVNNMDFFLHNVGDKVAFAVSMGLIGVAEGETLLKEISLWK
jgi:hypothetical protein